MPSRVQLRRTKGWRLPEGCINVARPTRWGNPYKVGAPHPVHGWPMSHEEAVQLYAGTITMQLDLDTLRGHDLACWCPLDKPCHADVLLGLANRGA